jgi:EmrB/QacA subfamily drug resistance transporter
MSVTAPTGGVRMSTPAGRAVVAAATLGSGMALLDGTVVNVALRTIGEDLGASLAQLQWITNAYLLTLASLILLGGSFGDRFGRRRVFVVGVVWFAVASLACGLAPSADVLIAARALQGVGGALLTPGSLAMIQGAFTPEDRAPAIGAWSGLGSIAAAIGPFVGGVLVDYTSWRWIFLLNLPLAAAAALIAVRAVPETRDPRASSRFDVAGAVLAAVALGGTTYALIEWGGGAGLVAAVVGVAAGVAFVLVEARVAEPMLDLRLFRDRTFSASNAMTLLVYGAIGALTFFVVIELQTVAGWTALAAGAAFVPMTIIMVLLASAGGRLGQRIGPRIPMSVGPLVMALGVLAMTRIGPGVDFWLDLLPAVVVFGLGLAMMVAPLTATVLGAAPEEQAGLASGVNNAVARAGSLLAVAALPIAVGLGGAEYAQPRAFDSAFHHAMLACAALLATGGAVSWLTIRRPARMGA